MGIGRQCTAKQVKSTSDLSSEARGANECLLSSLEEDDNAQFLYEQCVNDAKCHRMSEPVPYEDVDPDSVCIARRFSVEQGIKSDGSKKIRAVDDETRSGTNPCTGVSEKLFTEGIDKLLVLMQRFVGSTHRLPAMWKADVDSAYRRVPITRPIAGRLM